MINDFLFSVGVILPMVLLVSLGLTLRAKGFADRTFFNSVNRFVFYFGIPALLFISISTADISEIFDIGFVLFLSGFTFVTIALLWVGVHFILRNKAPESISAVVQGSFRGNAVIVAVPVLSSLLGEEGIALTALGAAILVPIYNIISTILLVYYSNKVESLSAKHVAKSVAKNPLISASALGVIVSVLDINLPGFLTTTIRQLSGVTTPMALICLGGGLSFSGFAGKFKYVIVSGLIKVLVMPIGAFLLAYTLGFRGQALVILTMIQSTPSAVAGYVMMVEIGGDTYVAGTNVLVTTVLSAFTMTLLIFGLRTAGLV